MGGMNNKCSWGPFLFLFLFGLFFFLMGCGITFFTVIRPLMLLDRSQEWTETPAQILSVKLGRHTGSEGGTTYRIEMRYQYEVDGQTYSSDRFTAFGGSDNMSNYHQKNYDHYKRLFDAKQPITCWVDPNDPTHAIIDRSPRFDMLMFTHTFTFTFPLIGLVVMLAGISSLRRPPTAPDTHRIPLTLHPLYFFAAPVALYLPYGIFLFAVFTEYPPPWRLWLLLLPPLILTLIFLFQYVRRKTFNGACLDITRTATIGDTLTGAIYIPIPIEGEFPIMLRCQCKHSAGNKTSYSTKWRTKTTATAVSDGMTTTLPIRIALPPDQPATTHPDASLRYYWQLRVKVKHFWLSFEIFVRRPVAGNAAAGGDGGGD